MATEDPDEEDEEIDPHDLRVKDLIAQMLSWPPSEADRLEDVWKIYCRLLAETAAGTEIDGMLLIQQSMEEADLKYNRFLADTASKPEQDS
ncbi:hypothetical protein HZA87_00740 [Candidatus Uhrbacteria bacterium]|nr:hypothetical protein [Candidatus Uhrbacteria bacterium]